MGECNDTYCNAVVGRLVDVATRPYWQSSDHRMVVIETDEPFVRTIVRRFVNNAEYAELLVDRMVCVYDARIMAWPEG